MYIQFVEYDDMHTMMNHSLKAWDHMQLKDVVVNAAKVELYTMS
jgi:hypothetical protein